MSRRAGSAVMSCPSKMMWPRVGSMARRTSRPVVVLPQPDSPTSPSVSPGSMAKLTPSTAWTTRGVRPGHSAARGLPRIGKCLTRSATSSSGAGGITTLPRGGRQPHGRPRGTGAPGTRRDSAARRWDSGDGTGSPTAAPGAPASCRRWRRAGHCRRVGAGTRSARGCTGGRARGRASTTDASSTTRPAYMTSTRWHICEMIPRSCETRSTAIPSSRASRRIRARTCAWIVTSSAVVGSSAMSRLGVQEIPIPIITRCAMPPLNWWG